MRYWLSVFIVLLFLGFTSSIAAANTKAVETMAAILLKLNHFPSDSEKGTLKALIEEDTTTAHERVVAQALINLEHKVSAEDTPKLEALLEDESAPEPVKTLATVILNLSHTPTEADKAKLQKLTS